MNDMKQQPEALRLADWLEDQYDPTHNQEMSASELRRLHAENEALRKCAVKYLTWLNIRYPEKSLEGDLTNQEMLESQRDELLDALQSLISDNHPEYIPSKLWKKARAAIAKAE